jgi:hypothetical protein
MHNAPNSRLEDVREYYERQLKRIQETYGEAMRESRTT